MSSNTPEAEGLFTHDEWMEVCLPWVAVSDAILRLPGDSVGANEEVNAAEYFGIPIYATVACLLSHPPRAGHPGFMRAVRELVAMHKKKGSDYGTTEDHFSNVRSVEELGIPAWLGAYMRARDKVKRLDKYCKTRQLANEGVEDSFLDNANYNLISLVLWREGVC
jgi:hypothetical protein